MPQSSTLSSDPVDAVLRRVAVELGRAASDLAEVEIRVAALLGHGLQAAADVEQLQALDSIGQRLRALEAFLRAAEPFAAGRVDLSEALGQINLEGLRERLAGRAALAVPSGEADLW